MITTHTFAGWSRFSLARFGALAAVLVLAFAGVSARATTVTYTISGSDGSSRLDATITVNRDAQGNESGGYRYYGSSPLVSASITVKQIATGQLVEQSTLSSSSNFYVIYNYPYSSYDWLIFSFATQNGNWVQLNVNWSDKQQLDTGDVPTAFRSAPTSLTMSGNTYRTFTQSVAISTNGGADSARVAELEAQVASLTTELATANQTIVELNGENDTLASAKTELQQQLATANARVAELENRIAALQSDLAAANATLAARDATIAQLEAQLAAARQTIATRDASIASLQTSLTDANNTIAGLQSSLAAAQGQVATLQGNLDAAGASLARLNAAFSNTFGASFAVRGSSLNDQVNALIDGILLMNRGSQQQLYFQLTGKK